VDAWNAWRDENPDIRLDLRSANLFKAELSGANLNCADLREANLTAANLVGANYAMFKDYWKYDWVLPVYRYEGLEALLTALAASPLRNER
jgi:hypothetical protein